MGTMRLSGRITQSQHTPLPANRVRGIVPTIGSWNYSRIGKALLDDGGVFSDDTTDAQSAAANDVPLLPAAEAINDKFYFGDLYSKFSAININIGTAGVGDTIEWEYWNGSAWASLTVADFTNGFTTAGSNDVNLVEPAEISAWQTTTVNGTVAYWVRARCTAANFTTQPLATQISIMASPDDLTNVTDGDWSTSTTYAKATTNSANENWGNIVFDRGDSINPILVIMKIDWMIDTGATSSNLAAYIESSSLADFSNMQQENSVAYFRGTAALGLKQTNCLSSVVYDRYFRVRFKADIATTVYNRIYEVAGYELGL